MKMQKHLKKVHYKPLICQRYEFGDDNGKLWALDHRRLAAFRIAELESVPFQWATEEEIASQMWKMTTKTNGTSIKLKLGNGANIIIQ